MSAEAAKGTTIIDVSGGQKITPEAEARSREAVGMLRHAATFIAVGYGVPALCDALVTILVQTLITADGEVGTATILQRVLDGVPQMALSMREPEGQA